MHYTNGKGWVKFHRRQWDHWVSTDKPYCRGYAWTYLYTNANHKGNAVCWDGNVIKIKRGELITSLDKLKGEWGWKSRHRVSDFLNRLEKEGMIQQKRTSRYTRITVVKYSNYQGEDAEKGSTRTSYGHQRDTNKNDKNNKKEYKDPMLDPR